MAKSDKDRLSDAALDGFFAAGRAQAPEPGADLMARIMADAEAEIAARAPAPAPRTGRRGRWAALVSGIGGWPALASMAAAALAGVWLGFASPDRLNTLSGGLLLPDSTTSYELEDLLPGFTGFETLAEEGQG